MLSLIRSIKKNYIKKIYERYTENILLYILRYIVQVVIYYVNASICDYIYINFFFNVIIGEYSFGNGY